VSHPDGLPDPFLDRSLGRIRVPAILRAGGLVAELDLRPYVQPRQPLVGPLVEDPLREPRVEQFAS
jgi:hypothetical protein